MKLPLLLQAQGKLEMSLEQPLQFTPAELQSLRYKAIIYLIFPFTLGGMIFNWAQTHLHSSGLLIKLQMSPDGSNYF